MFKTLRNKKGVTLVELLAVVVILGIIAAIAVPTIGGLISNQQEKADIATLTNVVAAAKNYATGEDETVFTLADIETEAYIDLGSNTLGNSAGIDDSADIYVQITGNTVTFWDDDPVAVGAAVLGSIFVNDTEVTLAAGVYVPE
jgi:type IV pilus assembly protein PilA